MARWGSVEQVARKETQTSLVEKDCLDDPPNRTRGSLDPPSTRYRVRFR